MIVGLSYTHIQRLNSIHSYMFENRGLGLNPFICQQLLLRLKQFFTVLPSRSQRNNKLINNVFKKTKTRRNTGQTIANPNKSLFASLPITSFPFTAHYSLFASHYSQLTFSQSYTTFPNAHPIGKPIRNATPRRSEVGLKLKNEN